MEKAICRMDPEEELTGPRSRRAQKMCPENRGVHRYGLREHGWQDGRFLMEAGYV
jgi:hypothetical protein